MRARLLATVWIVITVRQNWQPELALCRSSFIFGIAQLLAITSTRLTIYGALFVRWPLIILIGFLSMTLSAALIRIIEV